MLREVQKMPEKKKKKHKHPFWIFQAYFWYFRGILGGVSGVQSNFPASLEHLDNFHQILVNSGQF